MSVSDARLAALDRELDQLGSSEAIARGERAAKAAGSLDLASVDAELARLGEGVSPPAAAPGAIPAETPEQASALDVDSLFDDAAAASDLASLDGVGSDLGRASLDRTSRAPMDDSALDLAELLEGEDLDSTEIAIELDEE